MPQEQRYIISIENQNGKRVYLKKGDSYNYGYATTVDPHLAQQWSMNDDKAAILDVVEKARKNKPSSSSGELRIDTLRVERFTWDVEPVVATDADWCPVFRDNALAKLTTQEIEALEITKHEVYRRLKQ